VVVGSGSNKGSSVQEQAKDFTQTLQVCWEPVEL